MGIRRTFSGRAVIWVPTDHPCPTGEWLLQCKCTGYRPYCLFLHHQGNMQPLGDPYQKPKISLSFAFYSSIRRGTGVYANHWKH